jgi:3-hydroxybutyryl-CoA dehydratase
MSSWNRYKKGMVFSWDFSFTDEQINNYAYLSGDFSPLHLNSDFGRQKGYENKIVHGVLIASQCSRLIGHEVPDQNLVMTDLKLNFKKPTYPNNKINFKAEIVNISEATKYIEFKCQFSNNNVILINGNVSAIWRE